MRLGLKKRQTYARRLLQSPLYRSVVEAYRLDRYDNMKIAPLAYAASPIGGEAQM